MTSIIKRSSFSAYLTIENGIVIPSFVNEVLETPCPVCGREIEILLNGYACKGIRKRTRTTTEFVTSIYPNYCTKRNTIGSSRNTCQRKKTPFMTGFKSREGMIFFTAGSNRELRYFF